MLFNKPSKTATELEERIHEIATQLSAYDATEPQFETYVSTMERLYALKSNEDKKRLTAAQVAPIVANLVGIGMILSYERTHVITSKAIGFVFKPKQ